MNWYSPSREARFASLKNAQDIAEFLAQEKVDFVLLRITEQIISFAPEILLREHVARFGSAIAQEGHFSLYRLSEIPALYRKIFDLGASIKKTPEEAELLLPFSEAGVLASTELKRLAVLQTHRAKQARYSVVFSCPSEDGFFVAQINWDKGERLYYRLVACKPESVSFTEVIPIPVGANTGTLSVAARDTTSVQIRSLLVEIN